LRQHRPAQWRRERCGHGRVDELTPLHFGLMCCYQRLKPWRRSDHQTMGGVDYRPDNAHEE
jgi:hypothetical protein